MACKHRVLPVFRASNSTQFTVICCPALQSFILSHGTRESRDRGGNKYPSLWIGTWCQRKALWLTEVWNDGRLGDGLWPPRVGGNGEEYILNIHEMWTQDSVYHGYDPSLFGLMEWKNVCFLSLDTTSSGQHKDRLALQLCFSTRAGIVPLFGGRKSCAGQQIPRITSWSMFQLRLVAISFM